MLLKLIKKGRHRAPAVKASPDFAVCQQDTLCVIKFSQTLRDAWVLHMVQNSSLYSIRTVCVLRDELTKSINLYQARGALSTFLQRDCFLWCCQETEKGIGEASSLCLHSYQAHF
jgi:hypothetical protein